MDQKTIQKYKERFELSADDDVPSVVAFKAIIEGMKTQLRTNIHSTHQQMDRLIDRLNLTIEQPLPFKIAEKEYWSEEYFTACWKQMVEDAQKDTETEDGLSKMRAGKYILGLLQAAITAGVIKSTVGGWPNNFETPKLEKIEDPFRQRKDDWPSEGLKFSAKNKGTLQLHLAWR